MKFIFTQIKYYMHLDTNYESKQKSGEGKIDWTKNRNFCLLTLALLCFIN